MATKFKKIKTGNEDKIDNLTNQNLSATNQQQANSKQLAINNHINNNQNLNNTQQSDLLVLNYSTRDLIINFLNESSAFLYGRPLANDTEEKMIKKKQELVLSLSSLKFKQLDEDGSTDVNLDLVLDINRQTKLKSLGLLIKNISIAILNYDQTVNDAKKNLIDENNKLINLLLRCPVRLAKIESDHNSPIDKNQTNVNESNQMSTIRKMEANNAAFLASGFSKTIVKNLKSKPSQIVLTYKIKDLFGFFLFKKTYSSKTVCVNGLPFHIDIQIESKNDEVIKEYLGIYLNSDLNSLKGIWFVACKVKILAQKSGFKDKEGFFHVICWKEISSGFNNFISYNELIDENKGLIKRNSIVIEIDLEIVKTCEKSVLLK